jgi:hypothetical protein
VRAPTAERSPRPCAVSVTLPHRDAGSAARGLLAELRRRVSAGGEVADWDTLVLHGPRPSSDARGHVWFEYTAVVGCRPVPQS